MAHVYRRTVPAPWGVLKLYDLGGKVLDATPYTGQREIRFGSAYTPYLLAYAALVTPELFIPIDLGWHWQPVPEGATLAMDNLRVTTV